LISYWVAPARSFAWVISPDPRRPIARVALPEKARIAAAVKEARAAIEAGLRDPRALADSPLRALYDLVVAPLGSQLGPAVVIAPDGPLFGAPFAALVSGGRYWLQDVRLSHTPSLRLLPAAGDTAAAVDRARRAAAAAATAGARADLLLLALRLAPAGLTLVLTGARRGAG
jgi:CHAT domain-containing protein